MDLREKAIEFTREKLKQSLTPDLIIIQYAHLSESLNKTNLILIKKLKDILQIEFPELLDKIKDEKRLIEIISEKSLEEIKQTYVKETIGKQNLEILKQLSLKIQGIKELKNQTDKYIESLLVNHYPLLAKTAGSYIASRLLMQASSAENLAKMPSSKIQILGAEKAFFQSQQNQTRTPRFGVIAQHSSIAKLPESQKAREARALASAISKAIKQDYFI